MDNDIFKIRLSKTVIFVKICNETNIIKNINEIVIFEKLNNFVVEKAQLIGKGGT